MGFAKRAVHDWHLRTRTMTLGLQTRVMGIVNVTPDSFSDGGEHATTESAVSHALRLLDEGADVLDIGGESTRPESAAATAEAISTDEEQDRVLPVIEAVLRARPETVISIDTYRSATARAAIEAGAEIVNDVSGGLWDSSMLITCAELQCGVIVMHTRGLPSAWALQQSMADSAVVPQVLVELRERIHAAEQAGVARARVAADPGFGFGKRGAENWTLLAGFAAFADLQVPLVAGLSRKGFLASASAVTSEEVTTMRDDLTHAANLTAELGGAHIVRVHDVRGAVRSSVVADAVLAASA